MLAYVALTSASGGCGATDGCFTAGPTVDINKARALKTKPSVCVMLAWSYVSQEQRRICVYGTSQAKSDFNVQNVGENGNTQTRGLRDTNEESNKWM